MDDHGKSTSPSSSKKKSGLNLNLNNSRIRLRRFQRSRYFKIYLLSFFLLSIGILSLHKKSIKPHQIYHDNQSWRTANSVCHPPMSNLLIGRKDVNEHPAIQEAKEWANDYLQDLYNEGSVDSISLSVFGPWEGPVFEQGIGYLRANESAQNPEIVNSDSIFTVASVSKIFTALELYVLRDKGAIGLDDDIQKYLEPTFEYPSDTWSDRVNDKMKGQEPHKAKSKNNTKPKNKNKTKDKIKSKNKITCRELLSHLSGLIRDQPRNQKLPLHLTDKMRMRFFMPNSTQDMLNGIRDTPLTVSPYEYPAYSNMAFVLAGHIAENADLMYRQGRARENHLDPNDEHFIPYQDLVQRDILGPLKMQSSFFFNKPIPDADSSRLVVPSEFSSFWADFNLSKIDAAAGLRSTTHDLYLFGRALLSGYYDDQNDKKQEEQDDDRQDSIQFPLSASSIREWLRPIHFFDDSLSALSTPWEIFTFPPPQALKFRPYSILDFFIKPRQPNPRSIRIYSKYGDMGSYHANFFVDVQRQFGTAIMFAGKPNNQFEAVEKIATRFALAFDHARTSILAEKYQGTYGVLQTTNDKQSEKEERKQEHENEHENEDGLIQEQDNSQFNSNENAIIDEENFLQIKVQDEALWITKWYHNGTDMLQKGLFGRSVDNYLAMWPTDEPNLFRVTYGIPASGTYQGCFAQFLITGAIMSNGFPADLISLEEDQLFYPAANIHYEKEIIKSSSM